MRAQLQDTAPTTAAEKAVFRELDTKHVWCPLRDYFIDKVVCARLQRDHRRKCFRINGGCKHLDASWAEDLQQARDSR